MFEVAVHVPLPGSYSSADEQAGVVSYSPPVTSTVPSGSSVAVWYRRGVTILPVLVQDPLFGSYSSADVPLAPPARSTLPSGSSVAESPWPGLTIFRVVVQVPLRGSYRSATFGPPSGPLLMPLVRSTRPSASR